MDESDRYVKTEEPLRRCTVYLEEDQIDILEELSREYTDRLGQRWSKSAVIRLALSDFFTRIGKIS